MNSTLVRTVASFAVVVGAYWAYATFAEPLLAGPRAVSIASADGREAAASVDRSSTADQLAAAVPAPTERFRQLIEPLFPEGSWERTEAHVVKNDQFMLLWREIKTMEDRKLHVYPCTIVFQPQGIDDAADEHARTWIVQAPEGAELTFDQMDDRLMKMGRLQAATVDGPVTIRGSESRPGATDQIELTTQNVQLTEQRIWTPHEVHFRFGPHFGSGRDLTVVFSSPPRGEIKRLPATMPARLQSIELVQLDQLQISLPSQRSSVQPSGETVRRVVHTPVSITSGGPLLVDMARGVAQLSKAVSISRPRLDDTGLADQLRCDQLSLYFERRGLLGIESENDQPLVLERVVARGAPAVVFTSRHGGSLAEAEHALEAPKLELMLDGSQQFLAEGAGRLHGQLGDKPAQSLQLSWSGSASWQQNDTGPLITILQQPRCVISQLGRLDADRLQIQLAGSNSSSDADRLARLRPVSLLADGRVRVEARQLQAQVDRLSVAFQEGPLTENDPSASSGGLQLNVPRRTSSTANEPERRYIVSGSKMDLVALRDGQQTQIDDVVIQSQVRCVEVIGNNEGQGAEVTGDRFELHRIASGAAVGAIQGRPVQVRAGRIDVRGPVVRFEQAANRLWIEGAGSATVPLPPKMTAQLPGQMAIGFLQWRDRLEFDGTDIRAEGRVELRGPAQLIRCNSVSAQLSRRISLGAQPSQAPVTAAEIATIIADGGVFLENRTVTNERLVAVDSGNLRRIRIDNRSGELAGTGPGWIKTVRYAAPPGANRQAAPGGQREQQLNFLRVAFQGPVAGNLRSRSMQFEDRIQAVYGPVTSWDDEIAPDPRRLTQEQVTMRCDRLSVLQMARRRGAGWPLEIHAIGHTIVEAANFTARAHRLSYDQDKDQLVLAGDGQTDAQLWREDPGKSRQEMSAQKIRYEPKRNRVNIEGANTIELRG